MECKSTTHYAGCACHEARRDEEITRLREALTDCQIFLEYGGVEDACEGDERERLLKMCEEALNGREEE